jgi:hypothetical protein
VADPRSRQHLTAQRLLIEHQCRGLTLCINSGLCCWLQFKRQLLKEEAALRIYDKATDGEAIAGTTSSPTSCMQHA